MAEIQKPTIRTISGGIWGISEVGRVIEGAADDVGRFIDNLPEEHRGLAMDAIEAQIELRRESMHAQEAERQQD